MKVNLTPEACQRLQELRKPQMRAILRQAIRADANRMRDKLVADLMGRTLRRLSDWIAIDAHQ